MNRLIAFAACFLFAQSVIAQEIAFNFLYPLTDNGSVHSSTYRWGFSMGAGNISSVNGNAQERTATIRGYGDWGSIGLENLQIERFGLNDSAMALDAYPRLWAGAYANVRMQRTDSPSLYPSSSWRAEIYQNVGDGWELAASRDELKFNSTVHIDGLGLAKYWGNFYFRWRHQHVASNSSSGNGDRFVARYYYEGDADHYLEATISKGRSEDATSNILTSSHSDTRGLVWYHFLDRTWGLKGSFSQSTDTSFSGARERNTNVSITYRW